MRDHREDLVKRLDRVLDRGRYQKPRLFPYIFQQGREEYGKIREILPEVGKGAVGTQTRTSPAMNTLSLKYAYPVACT